VIVYVGPVSPQGTDVTPNGEIVPFGPALEVIVYSGCVTTKSGDVLGQPRLLVTITL
jgi:hypothetical protein